VSKRTRAGIVAAMLAAMTLAGMTAVAHAQSNDKATSNQAARRPPTQAQVGEAWRQPQVPAEVPAEAPTVAGDPRRPPTESQVGESWRHPVSAPMRPAELSGPSGWLLASLGGLAAALALIAGLAVLATRRAGRRARLGHAA
jgi:hypothetical protein